ncbi:hypothetical protein [Rudaeicoccus suwonensis]|uniref:Uncharacterized protein n=1 Tax=Rudaeicoccus suwonensis TaxID=657409 RepID=A0A561DVJ4_9MICO|nr:hypothetical protein [Rudaeicoccus suwonensis]TWE07364.1 hypothetical protein BKA23_3377 [Rudaeicoccus suwonensis]
MEVAQDVIYEAAVLASVPVAAVALTRMGEQLVIDGFTRPALVSALVQVQAVWRERARLLGERLATVADASSWGPWLTSWSSAVLHAEHAAWMVEALGEGAR